MKTSQRGIDLLTEFEGFRSTAYRDVAGIWTIGYGTTRIYGRPVRSTDVCSKDEARAFMANDLSRFERAVNEALPADGTQSHFDALVAFCYNVGVNGFQKSTIYRKLKLGTVLTVTEENFTVWNKARIKGKLVVIPGLTRRRRAEYQLFISG